VSAGSTLLRAPSLVTEGKNYNHWSFRVSEEIFLYIVVSMAACIAVYFFVEPPTRFVAFPAAALASLALVFFFTLTRRDGQVPLFELGTMCVAATMLYSLYPLLQFLLSGMMWSVASDNRLLQYAPGPAELESFGWRNVLYLVGFSMSYLLARGRSCSYTPKFVLPDAPVRHASILLLLVVGLISGLIYASIQGSLFARQVWQNLIGINFLLKQALLVLILSRWRYRRWRWLLGGWLAWEVTTASFFWGSRTEIVLLLISTILLYHHMVRSLAIKAAYLVFGAIVTGFILWGIARNFGGQIILETGEAIPVWSHTNEFQSLLGTQFDLFSKIREGDISDIPWQLYFSDVLILIPSQLLPFDKLNPADWYLDVAGLRETGFGGMFSVISQAIVGLDWIELLVRGCLLGYVFAFIHRWYVSRAQEFWPTLFYLFMCIWSYYTYRATTFYFVYFIVYRFVPVLIVVHLGADVLRGALRRVPLSRTGEGRF
jgi:hypothetical protein